MMYLAVWLGSQRECGSSNEGEGSGEGSNGVVSNTQAESEETTNQSSLAEFNIHPVHPLNTTRVFRWLIGWGRERRKERQLCPKPKAREAKGECEMVVVGDGYSSMHSIP